MKNIINSTIKTLSSGNLVCFPTETVFALAANANSPDAIRKIYEVKGRDFNKPLALLVPDFNYIDKIAHTDKRLEKLVEAFCPGPITFILNIKPNNILDKNFNNGIDKIAVRIPDNKTALDIITSADFPIAATSANFSGKSDSLNAKEAENYFGDKVAIIIKEDGCEVGIASTIVDMATNYISIVRQGAITLKDIESALAN